VDEGFDAPCDVQLFKENFPRAKDTYAYSQGNFHGQPLALAADFLAIAVAELASISERRTQMLLDKHHNRNLPANLTALRGVQSGLMIAQYTAASLVSENKVLTHPASVDSIPTSANSEDHNSMSTVAARKLRSVLVNSQNAVAIEWLAAAQALDWRVGLDIDPNGGGAPAPADAWAAAEEEARRFDEAMRGKPAARASKLGKGAGAAYLAIRERVAPLTRDRVLAEDVARLRQEVASRDIQARVAPTGAWLAPIAVLR
jgi:histidine ammonia-lyase